jgi:hypothetical protein
MVAVTSLAARMSIDILVLCAGRWRCSRREEIALFDIVF